MNDILTERLVMQAIELARPSALAILQHPGTTWGPKYVMGSVSCPIVEGGIVSFRFGDVPEEWDTSWGDEFAEADFFEFAERKRMLAERGGGPTSQIVVDMPWLLRPGDNLYPGGTAYGGLSCGVSGATGEADELIAKLVLSMVIGLTRMEAKHRVDTDQMVIA